MKVLWASATTDPAATAGVIAHGIRVDGAAEIQVIGPRAVDHAVKAIAIARGCVAASGIDMYCIPSFASVHVGAEGTEEDRTGLLPGLPSARMSARRRIMCVVAEWAASCARVPCSEKAASVPFGRILQFWSRE
jgi:stage V sporulation protein S